MGSKSSVLIIILVFGVLFSFLSISQLVRTAGEIKTQPSLTENEAMNIAIADLEKKVAPLHLDRYVETQQYFGSSAGLVFLHKNGTVYEVLDDRSIHVACEMPGCQLGDGNEQLKGRLLYDIDGSWQDASVGNCSPFLYLIDANSGAIMWSRVDDASAPRCDVRPPGWS